MRPVELRMHGFGTFREPTTVEFADAEYFALVGPTGAGKSTVIDAMTFALYGSVPRWDDRRTVALALSPTANRGTVRLVFDVGADRYAVARELRRAASGAVTVRNARLERLLDPAAPDGDTEVLAHDSAVSKAVEELLGLPFEQFCVCVVLPQGEFAQFLHAKPADRQRTLSRILGLGTYEAMAKDAGTEAKLAAQRAELLAEQLTEYADATPAAAEAAQVRESALTALLERVHAAVAELAEADAELDGTQREAQRLRCERDLLAGLRAPDGLVELAAHSSAADTGVALARQRLAEQEAADSAARQRLAAAPQREPLRQLLREHAERAQLSEQLPELSDRAERTARDTERARAGSAAAETALEAARGAREKAARAADEVRTQLDEGTRQSRELRGLKVPDGVEALQERRRTASERLSAARAALRDREAAEAQARQASAGAPERGVLTRARRDLTELAEAWHAHHGAAEQRRRRGGELTEADAAVAAAERALAQARREREHHARDDLVAALRPELTLHQPCPVCAQHVERLPPPAEGAGLRRADEELGRATEYRDGALRAQRDRAAAERRATAAEAAARDRVQALRSGLDGLPALDELPRPGEPAGSGTPAEPSGAGAEGVEWLDRVVARHLELIDTQLAESRRLARDAERAQEQLSRARRDRELAGSSEAEVADAAAQAADRLRAARDPLVALGAPRIDAEDLAASWSGLVEWARAEVARRAEWLAALDGESEAAWRTGADAERALVAAAERARRLRDAETEAVRAEQDAAGELARARARGEQLAAALEDADPPERVRHRLAELDRLDERAGTADRALRRARTELAEASSAAEQVAERVEAGWRALRAARDPLVALGAPAQEGPAEGGTHLAGAWRALTGWAAGALAERSDRLALGEEVVRLATERRDEAHRALAEDLRAHQVQPPAQRPLLTAAAPAASAELERARAAVARVAERRAWAGKLAAEQADARRAGQVARTLAGLLRSDAFPRWLAASALDTLVLDASRSLAELSGGQFELTHSDGEFLVVDHADADARRPVKTLSGGETFQASLALALALSEQLSTLASAGAARLDSIFLDEGFGTLDESNLDVVASTLENLASLGNRMVGVVTHVSALAERVPVRFVVSRDQHGSTLTRQG